MQSAGTESIRASQRSENVAAGCVRMLEWRSGSVAEPVLICRALAAWEKPCDSTRLNTESLEHRVAGTTSRWFLSLASDWGDSDLFAGE